MTDKELAEVEKACAEATPGPWFVSDSHGMAVTPATGDCIALLQQDYEDTDPWVGKKENARLIAESRSWLPALVAEVRRLRAHIEACAWQLDGVDNYQPGGELAEISAKLRAGAGK